MAKVLAASEVVSRLRNIRGLVQGLIQARLKIDRIAKTMEQEGQLAVDVETFANTALTQWGADRDEIVDMLSDLRLVHQSRVLVGMPPMYDKAAVLATNESNLDTYGNACALIRVGGVSVEDNIDPFSVFLSGDRISISRAEDASNNITGAQVLYTPEAAGSTPINYGYGLWSAGSGWTITGSTKPTLTLSASAAATASKANLPKANMSVAWTNGHRYLVQFTLSGVSGGSVSVGTNTAAYYTATANGVHYAVVVADSNSAGLVFASADATAFTGVVSDIVMLPFTGLMLNRPLGADNIEDSKLIITLEER